MIECKCSTVAITHTDLRLALETFTDDLGFAAAFSVTCIFATYKQNRSIFINKMNHIRSENVLSNEDCKT